MEVVLSGWSLLPSLLAVGLALATRQVFIALFIGIWAGAWLIEGASGVAIGASLLKVVDTYLIHAIVPPHGGADHFSIVLFSLLTGAMIGIISRNGGMQGVVTRLSRVANTPRKGQGVTFALGGLVFFDDYANTLIVGKTMRPLMDALRVSRQKLAFIVDSTAAPIASMAVVTTWVGFQVSLLDDAVEDMELATDGFSLVLAALPYSFYPLLMLCFIAILVISGRDFGPMLKAERNARALHDSKAATRDDMQQQPSPSTDEEFLPHEVKPLALNALIPILAYIGGTVAGLLATGSGATLTDILGSANPFRAILWGATLGLFAAIILSLATKRLNLPQTMDALEAGIQPMMLAVMILTLAWALAAVNEELRTAEYLVSVMGDGMPIALLPVAVFVIAAATSFATGSSWATMGILVPLVLPLAYQTLSGSTETEIITHPVLLASIASVLTGAVWGDHCSPISDTTILSSMASDCPHMEHVRTQMPYAIVIASVSAITGLIPVGLGMAWWLGLLIGIVLLSLIVWRFGKPVA